MSRTGVQAVKSIREVGGQLTPDEEVARNKIFEGVIACSMFRNGVIVINVKSGDTAAKDKRHAHTYTMNQGAGVSFVKKHQRIYDTIGNAKQGPLA